MQSSYVQGVLWHIYISTCITTCFMISCYIFYRKDLRDYFSAFCIMFWLPWWSRWLPFLSTVILSAPSYMFYIYIPELPTCNPKLAILIMFLGSYGLYLSLHGNIIISNDWKTTEIWGINSFQNLIYVMTSRFRYTMSSGHVLPGKTRALFLFICLWSQSLPPWQAA